ncbi:hypothetical protein G3O00_19440 [Burkholderia sp. Ac-20384]|uniref:hypothetical protein n=1 Tax=Burkholderia sp. Ac-20384 TaxID=2703902 RepID=UPI00197E3897|nr:hypothetical protein [Burkholderia sp. Ac-20384]MBN3825783.1 hypothetical protein [Burkholderia sp. Ac-20384]
MKSSDICIADAQIKSFSYRDGRLSVLIQAEDRVFEIIFHAVLGMKVISPEGQDLSHLAESKGGGYLVATCEAAEEPVDGYREFGFISAWTDESLLTVIANDVKISKATN